MAVLSYSCVTRVTKQEAPASASIDRPARHCAREWVGVSDGYGRLRGFTRASGVAPPQRIQPSTPAQQGAPALRSGLGSDETEQRG